jgi:hypothetical protein
VTKKFKYTLVFLEFFISKFPKFSKKIKLNQLVFYEPPKPAQLVLSVFMKTSRFSTILKFMGARQITIACPVHHGPTSIRRGRGFFAPHITLLAITDNTPKLEVLALASSKV